MGIVRFQTKLYLQNRQTELGYKLVFGDHCSIIIIIINVIFVPRLNLKEIYILHICVCIYVYEVSFTVHLTWKEFLPMQ